MKKYFFNFLIIACMQNVFGQKKILKTDWEKYHLHGKVKCITQVYHDSSENSVEPIRHQISYIKFNINGYITEDSNNYTKGLKRNIKYVFDKNKNML